MKNINLRKIEKKLDDDFPGITYPFLLNEILVNKIKKEKRRALINKLKVILTYLISFISFLFFVYLIKHQPDKQFTFTFRPVFLSAYLSLIPAIAMWEDK